MAGSGNDWLELYATEETDLSNWTITYTRPDESESYKTISLEKEGSVSAGYHVVGGTPPVNTKLTLANTGLTLKLYDSDTLVDTVEGGGYWREIGGDNDTKETAQYIDGDWYTATATPGVANIKPLPESDPDPPEESDPDPSPNDSKESNKSSSKAKPAIQLKLPDHTLKLQITAPDTVYVNHPVNFSVTPSGITEKLLPSVQYRWNYGDAYTGSGKESRHHFTHPGTYVVVVSGTFARHSGLARHQIIVKPVTLSLTLSGVGEIIVHNDAVDEINISGYVLKGDSDTYTFPQHTTIVSGGTITLPQSLFASGQGAVTLSDTTLSLVATYLPEIDFATGTSALSLPMELEINSLPIKPALIPIAEFPEVIEIPSPLVEPPAAVNPTPPPNNTLDTTKPETPREKPSEATTTIPTKAPLVEVNDLVTDTFKKPSQNTEETETDIPPDPNQSKKKRQSLIFASLIVLICLALLAVFVRNPNPQNSPEPPKSPF